MASSIPMILIAPSPMETSTGSAVIGRFTTPSALYDSSLKARREPGDRQNATILPPIVMELFQQNPMLRVREARLKYLVEHYNPADKLDLRKIGYLF